MGNLESSNGNDIRKLKSYMIKLRLKLKNRYSSDESLCLEIKNLYEAGKTQEEIAEILLNGEYLKSSEIIRQVISDLLKELLDPENRLVIARQKGNKNLKHDSDIQSQRGKLGGEKKSLDISQATNMGQLSHSDKIPQEISKELYNLRNQREKIIFLKIQEKQVALTGNRDQRMQILSNYVLDKYNILKSPNAIRGIIERERSRTKEGKEIFQEFSEQTRNAIMKEYLEFKQSGAKTFIYKDKTYTTNVPGMLLYIQDKFGVKRTRERFFLYLKRYKNTLINYSNNNG